MPRVCVLNQVTRFGREKRPLFIVLFILFYLFLMVIAVHTVVCVKVVSTPPIRL